MQQQLRRNFFIEGKNGWGRKGVVRYALRLQLLLLITYILILYDFGREESFDLMTIKMDGWPASLTNPRRIHRKRKKGKPFTPPKYSRKKSE